MYCKHCGREIADDSKFCQHCGGKLDNNVEVIKGDAPIDKIVSKMFSNINKKYLYAYAIWVVLNIILLCYGSGQSYATQQFYPFTYWGFELDYYDSTEFITYVILIPLLVLYYIQYWHEPLKRKIKSIKSKNGNNATSCHNTEKSKISKLEAVLEEPSEITDNTVNHNEKTEDFRGNQSEGVNDDPSLSLKSDYKQDRIQSEPIINGEQNIINETELQETNESEKITEEGEKGENNEKNKESKKIDGCITIFLIAFVLLFSHFFIIPMAKLYMRQRMNHQIEASGVYGAGLDRAEPIMVKIRKEAHSSLGMFGKLKKTSYGLGTIILEFEKDDYHNFPKGNSSKVFVLSEIQTMPTSMKNVMKEIVEEDFSLSIEIHPSETSMSRYTRVNLSPYELGKVLNR